MTTRTPQDYAMTDKYEALRKAAQAATPGPWFHGAKNGDHKYCVYDKICWTDPDGSRHGDTPNMVVHVSPDDGRFYDAAFIAAANPSVILELLADRDHLRQESNGWFARVQAVESELYKLREALDTISAYPFSRDEEMGVETMRKIAREALNKWPEKGEPT